MSMATRRRTEVCWVRSQEMAARISDATEQTAQTARVASYELSDSLETMRSIMASPTNCDFKGLRFCWWPN